MKHYICNGCYNCCYKKVHKGQIFINAGTHSNNSYLPAHVILDGWKFDNTKDHCTRSFWKYISKNDLLLELL